VKLRLGTRGSDLARTQSGHIATALAAHGIETEFVIISTSGDRSTAPTFGAIGAQGVFVREIEQALLDNEIDLAVHSYKDLPTSSPANLTIAAIPPRRDPADWLFLHAGAADVSAEGFGRDRRRPGMAGAEPQGRSSGVSRRKPSAAEGPADLR
jgi:hydroxymethylbilane synthase